MDTTWHSLKDRCKINKCLKSVKGKKKVYWRKAFYTWEKINIIILLGSVNVDNIKACSGLLYCAASILAKPCKRPKMRKDPQQK